MIFQLRLAGVCIRVTSLYEQVCDYCRNYLDPVSQPNFSIDIRSVDIEQEALANHEAVPTDPERLAYLETLAVYRKIAEALLDRDILLMHGSVIATGQSAVMFTAPSGTGKTTHTRLWLDRVPGCYVVNGDKPLLHIGETITAFGTPWSGKENMNRNCSAQLKAICLLERGEINHIERVSFIQIWQQIMKQIYLPRDPARLEQTMHLMDRLCRQMPFYRLRCNMEPDSAAAAWKELQPILTINA